MSVVNVDVGGIAGGLFKLIDSLFTTEEDRQNAKIKLLELEQAGQLAQIGVNAAEAQSESIFVAGWRPAVGWTCVAAFAYNFILQPFIVFLAWLVAFYTGTTFPIDMLPTLDMAAIITVLLGMLGLGGLRTIEKHQGVNTNR
jgi:hypothetical protein